MKIADRLLKHLLSLIGAIVTIAALLALLTSETVKIWVKAHSYWVFIAFALSFAGAFIVIDLVISKKRREATAHDRQIFANFLNDLPPNSGTVMWLKESFISKYAPTVHLDLLEKVHSQMRLNVVGLDDAQANHAYHSLRNAIDEFYSTVCFNMFLNREYTRMEMSPKWSESNSKKARDEIYKAHGVLVEAYDDFLRICHKNRLD